MWLLHLTCDLTKYGMIEGSLGPLKESYYQSYFLSSLGFDLLENSGFAHVKKNTFCLLRIIKIISKDNIILPQM